ncbi:adhesion G protein-coupled receptor F5-like isoform X8 [Xiphophorus couchianus]|uniref:adhesion G protein-coupled receptor F5-like isoform X8 n=1 Tax=Xiphophorus couchianus TaxID=32473 RepID=UPI0010163F94|nr:adhesion G protein-coupled receptor F5-like isoform X8 [Xiphophorus couchianus]
MRMALLKALRFGVLMLVICFTLDQPGFRQSVSVFFQDLRDATSSILHAREKRGASSALSNFTEHDLQFVITFSDLESLQRILGNISFPIAINNTVEINSIETTTVCSPNITGYQCICEENFAWSYNNCITYGVCDAIIGDTCGCINDLPAGDQFCQSNSSQTVTTTATPSSTQAIDLVDIDVDIVLFIPTSRVSSSIFSYIRSYLQSITFPIPISQSLGVKELHFTTACDPNSANGLQCLCEIGFAWPCDTCNSSNSCNDPSNPFCTCLNGLPSNNDYCQLITNSSVCPTPSPTPVTTVSTTPPPIYEIDLVLEVHIPFSSYQSDTLNGFRESLNNKTFLTPFSKSLNITELFLTTVCDPNSTYGYQCVCESGFAWPCDMCSSNSSCSSQICTCIYGLPSSNEFCEPITDNSICPTSVDIDVDIVVFIPTSRVSSNIISYFRSYLHSITFPIPISQSLGVKELHFTTACDPNSANGLQCQCESGFAWPCDTCNSSNSCNDQTCTCLYGLPPNNEFCQPVSNATICKPTPAPPTVDIDVDIVVFIPTSRVSSNIISYFRSYLHSITFPIPISQSLGVKELHFTTACDPNSANGLQCQCESGFAWPCDTCNSSNSCNDQTCTCLYGLPPNNEFCQPVSNATICKPTPAPPTVDIDVDIVVFIPTSRVSSNIISYFRSYLHSITFPIPISQSLGVKELHFTTACDPNSANGLQCQCESGFAWPCDTCNSSNSCNNQTCTCLYGLPPNNEFCQPVSNATICKPTPAPPTDTEVILVFRVPASIVQNYTLPLLKSKFYNLTNSVTLPAFLNVKEINLTTVCSPHSPEQLRCQCEDSFAWPCDLCNTSNSCNGVTSQQCTCRDGLSSINQYCQPLQSSTPCLATTSLPFITSPPPTMTTLVATPSPITATPVATSSPTTATPVATPSPKNVLGTFTMDMPFSESFNEKNNVVYQTVYNATLNKCTIVLAKCAVKNLNFKAGSTIANYELNVFSSETPTEIKVQITKNEILSEVASKYPVSIVSSSPLSVDKDPLYAGDTINVTCDPSGLTIGNYEILWTREGGELPKQSTFDKYSILIREFSKYDDGMYGCKITFGAGSTFTQTRQLTSRALPLITVSPIKDRVRCSGTRLLTCQVDELKVTLFDPNGRDLGVTSYTFTPPTPCADGDVRTYKCKLTERDSAKEITLVLTTSVNFDCTSDIYGNAMIGDTGIGKCDTNYVGEKTAVCMAGGNYGDEQNNCVLQVIVDLLDRSKNLNTLTIPVFLEDLKNATVRNNDLIIKSPATIIAMIKIFENVANTTSSLNVNLGKNSTRNFLESAGLLTIDNARGSWTFLNYNDTKNTTEDKLSRSSSSSAFLNVFENLPSFIGNDSLDINTDFILLNKTRLTDPFNSVYNSSVDIEIPQAGGEEKFITIIIFASMYNVLPGRDQLNTSTNRVHGRVALVRPEVEISNISLTFDVINYTNDTIGNPKCVFWDFSLYDGLGGWSDNGCSLVYFENETVSCNCNHTTSFSILMSPDSPRSLILDYITYIGVGISMACLVICLIIEAIIWRKINKNATSYLRHVSIVNIALSLLIANIWFIIGAAISDADQKNPPACTAATFFIHFFYLALFFWMLASALLLLYRTLSVFDGGLSKLTMLIIGFSLGYGAPLIIVTITIAATAPSNEYIRENVICWLNWYESKALLAFVVPALLIVVINFVILIVVLYKILRRRVGGNAAQTGEKHVLYVIARSLAVLTPFFGLTWGLGVGVMVSPQNFGINVAFAFFNSLQGFFILVFGTLLDKKVWSAMNIPSLTSQGRTQSTSAGTSSSGLSNLFRKIRINRGSRSGYHMSSTGQSASNDSFNT